MKSEWVANDASLGAIDFSFGTLIPDFHRLETQYTLLLDGHLTEISIQPRPLNPKSRVEVKTLARQEGKQIALLHGDTPIGYTVTSGDGSASQTYHVTLRKGGFSYCSFIYE